MEAGFACGNGRGRTRRSRPDNYQIEETIRPFDFGLRIADFAPGLSASIIESPG
jgi:hypothetical protein